MPRLIDANALVEFAREGDKKTKAEGAHMLLTFLRNMVELQPTVDAVPVIRCKDCARNPKDGHARIICPCPMDRYMGDDGFCSKAEPKVKK